MRFCKLGESGPEVSRVAFGCWAIVGGFNWGHQDEAESLAALRAAFDAGVTLFDTAELYGHGLSERLVGRALGEVRNQVVIASKVSPSHLRAAELKTACERSLRNLGTDRIDLYQLHWPNREVPLEESARALEELQREGKVLHVGVSNFNERDLAALLACGVRVVSNQLAYNLLFRAIEFEILPACRRNHVSVLCYSPIMQGLLAGKFAGADAVPDDRARTRHFAGTRPHARHHEPGAEIETFAAIEAVRTIAAESGRPMAALAVAWLLAQAGVACAICGGRTPAQARRNAAAADVELSPALAGRLAAATAALKEKLGANADMWCAGEEARI